MRKILILILSIASLTGCGRKDGSSVIEVHPSHISCGNEGGTFEISITGTDRWTTDNTEKWIDVRRAGDDAAIVIFPNGGGERRHRINFQNGLVVASLTIRQESSGEFSINPQIIRCRYDGDVFTASLECYERWSASCNESWISISSSEGDGPEDIEITIARSQDSQARTAEVEFACGDKTLTLTVFQDASPYMEVEDETLSIDGDGGIMNILYISNTEVEISTDDDWIRLIEDSGDVKKIALEVLRNPGGPRTGHIMLRSAEYPEYARIITIEQGAKINHPSISFAEGGHMDISEKGSFKLTPVFTDMTDTGLEWSSSSPEKASVDNEGMITVHTGGECIITASNDVHKVSAGITLNIRIKASDMKIMLDSQDMEENPVAVRFPGEKLEVHAILSPAEAYTGDLVCISSDPSVAKADGMGITCISPGKCTIYAESLYHGIIRSFELIILED